MRPLFGDGDRLEELNIVVVGYVVTTRSQPKGDDAATDIVEPVRPLHSLRRFTAPRAITARTVTSAGVIIIAAPELRPMVAKAPALRFAFINQTLNDVRELTWRITDSSF